MPDMVSAFDDISLRRSELSGIRSANLRYNIYFQREWAYLSGLLIRIRMIMLLKPDIKAISQRVKSTPQDAEDLESAEPMR